MASLSKSIAALIGLAVVLPSLPVLGCDTDLEVVVQGPTKQEQFNQTGALAAGSDVKLRITSQANCYSAIFWKDVDGQVFNLASLSDPKRPTIKMGKGETQLIPDSWLTLDNKTGVETIYLVSDEQPIGTADALGLLMAVDDVVAVTAKVAEQGFALKIKTIEHQVAPITQALMMPPRSKRVSTSHFEISTGVSPRKPNISVGSHKARLAEAKRDTTASLRGATPPLISKVGRSVAYIFHDEGSGSGIIVNGPAGLIVTNHHVVEGFDEVGIVFSGAKGGSMRDQRTYVADVIKIRKQHDLALVKLRNPPRGLRALPFGNEATLRPGMEVNAIGHPRGLLWSFTKGYVSQIRPQFVWGEGHQADVIQSQTPINPGNSGGPLFTDTGKLIGINTFGFGETDQGLNFAVSVAHVKELVSKGGPSTVKDSMVESLSDPGMAKEAYDQNENGRWDLFCFDTDQNGVVDICLVDEDEDGQGEYWKLDLNENHRFDGVIIEGEVGYLWLFDQDEDGSTEAVGHDENSDGRIDTYAAYSD